MKTVCRLLVCLLVLCLALPGAAETVTFQDFSADTSAEYLNLDTSIQRIQNWDRFIEFLSQFPNLKKVDMFNVPLRDQRPHQLHAAFPDVEFGMTMIFEEHELRTDATAFSTLHGYNPKWHSCAQLSVVKYCKNLYALDIGHNQFDDLSFLEEMPQLRVLIVAAGNAKNIDAIGSLKHLEYLEIFNNAIEDISCLKDMPYLMDLNIVENLIDDISPLKGLKSLKRLWIYNHSRRSPGPEKEEVLQELQKALPDCYIDGVSTSTAGGWRENPHYDVIYRMFRTREYEPFADSPPENIPEGFSSRPVETEEPAAIQPAQ